MKCTHCGGETRRVSATPEHGGFVLRHKLVCDEGHATESLEIPCSTSREMNLEDVLRKPLQKLDASIQRHLDNEFQREQRRRRRARVVQLLEEGWKVVAVVSETGMTEAAVYHIKKAMSRDLRS